MNLSNLPPLSLFEKLKAFLDEEGVRGIMIGGCAVNYWGVDRPTPDIDLSVTSMPKSLLSSQQVFGKDFRRGRPKKYGFLRGNLSSGIAVLTHQEGKVDLLVDQVTDWTPEEERAVPGLPFPVVALECLVTLKLAAWGNNSEVDEYEASRKKRHLGDLKFLLPKMSEENWAALRQVHSEVEWAWISRVRHTAELVIANPLPGG